MYLEEEGLSVPTPDHWTRSHTELGWLRTGARKHILRRAPQSHPPASLTQRLVDQLLAEWVEQHVSHKKPLAYILGDVPFGDLTFTIRPPVLIPRPETEQWVTELSRTMSTYFQAARAARASVADKPGRPCAFKVLDIGTGSGCISNYLAYHHPEVHVVGVDVDQAAVGLARENGAQHRTLHSQPTGPAQRGRGRASFFNLDLFSPTFVANLKQASQSLAGFDMLLSNPPYIPLAHYHALPRSVTGWESRLALVGQRSHPGLAAAPDRLLSRRNTPSGDYGFFTSYRSALSLPEPHPVGPDASPPISPSSDPHDGLDFYRHILLLVASAGLLKPDHASFHHRAGPPAGTPRLPKLVFEVGHGQAAPLKALLLHALPAELSHVRVLKDFAGVERTLLCY